MGIKGVMPKSWAVIRQAGKLAGERVRGHRDQAKEVNKFDFLLQMIAWCKMFPLNTDFSGASGKNRLGSE